MDYNQNNYENNGYQPPVEPTYQPPQPPTQPQDFQTPQYGAPQYNAPQPEYQQPQYGAPQQPQYGAPQPPYGQPMYAPMVEKDESKGMAIASLVCGILSLTCCCGSFIPNVLAIIFGIISRNRKKDNNGMALAGIILGAIGIVFSIIWIAFSVGGGLEDLMNEMMYY